MKGFVSCVLVLCITVSQVLGAPTAGGSVLHKVDQAKSKALVVGEDDYTRLNEIHEDRKSQTGKVDQNVASTFGQNAANRNQAAGNAAQTAQKASSAVTNQKAASSNAAAQAAVADNYLAAQRNFLDGNNLNKGINYAYDKKFDLNDNQRGAYVYADDSNSKVQDSLFDSSSSFNQNADNAAASGSAADSQSNSRASQADLSNAANQASRDNFGRNIANDNQLAAFQKDFSNKLDSIKNADRIEGLSRNDLLASDIGGFQNDWDYQKAGLDGGVGGGDYGPGSNYGPGSVSDKAARYGDSSSKGKLDNLQAQGEEDRFVDSYSKDNRLKDRSNSIDSRQGIFASDVGYSNKAALANQQAQKANGDAASAQAAQRRGQEAFRGNEDTAYLDARTRAAADSAQNRRVFEKYFNDDDKNGNNWERLKYNNDDNANRYGFNTQQATQNAFQNAKTSDNLAQAAIANNAAAASNKVAARQAQLRDANKAGNGYSNQLAASRNLVDDDRDGFNNGVWNGHKTQKQAAQTFDDNKAVKGTGFFAGAPIVG